MYELSNASNCFSFPLNVKLELWDSTQESLVSKLKLLSKCGFANFSFQLIIPVPKMSYQYFLWHTKTDTHCPDVYSVLIAVSLV